MPGARWLVEPVDLPLGSLTQVESVVYRTTFGESSVMPSCYCEGCRDSKTAFTTGTAENTFGQPV